LALWESRTRQPLPFFLEVRILRQLPSRLLVTADFAGVTVRRFRTISVETRRFLVSADSKGVTGELKSERKGAAGFERDTERGVIVMGARMRLQLKIITY